MKKGVPYILVPIVEDRVVREVKSDGTSGDA